MYTQTVNTVQETEVQLRSIEQAGRILGLGRTKINELLADGQLQKIKIGRKVLIPQKSIANFLRALGV